MDANDTVVGEADAGVAEQPYGLKEIMNHHGFEDIEFKMSGSSADIDGNVIAHNLAGDHGHGFGLGRIYFTRHDRAAGFILRENQLTDAAAWSGAE